MSSSTLTKAQPAAPVNANVTTSQIFPNRQVPAGPAVLAVLGSGRLEQKKFTVRASGTVTTGGAANVTVTLYAAKAIPGVPFTPGNWAVLAASTARAVATATSGFLIEADLELESVGGSLQGRFFALVNNLMDAYAAITNPLTGLNGTGEAVGAIPAAEPVFYLAVGITFSAAAAGNTAALGEFVLDC